MRKFKVFLQRPLTSLQCLFRNFSIKVTKESHELKSEYDVVVIGAGHNGLVAAAYLQKAGKSVCVLERRHVIGGAAVTEEIVPGFKFSRASYVLSLLRPFIISDLKLKENGLKLHMREPYSSFTPISTTQWDNFPSKYLLLSGEMSRSVAEIAKFSKKDAQQYAKYEQQMSRFVKAINILLGNRPPHLHGLNWEKIKSLQPAFQAGLALGKELPAFHEILTASAEKILDKWFQSEPLKATLATDALIGNFAGPATPGTGYVLLHHCMGGVDGKAGAWAYAEGGMGAVSQAIATTAAQLGASIFTEKQVKEIRIDKSSKPKANGVILTTGQEIKASAVLSNATPEVTFKQLFHSHTPDECVELFGPEFITSIDKFDYTSPVTKINVAVSRLPNFIAKPNEVPETVQDLHKCTIHLNSESMGQLGESYNSAVHKKVPSDRPLIEMVIPSSLDNTIAPPGAHVCLFFTQFTPMSPSDGSWSDPDYKQAYANKVFNIVEEYAPGFKQSIVGTDVLTPYDLEKTFGLTGGNIFHGSMSLDQLYWLRPASSKSSWFPATPLKNLYLCGSGAHPGGGVMGLPGYLAAQTLLTSKS